MGKSQLQSSGSGELKLSNSGTLTKVGSSDSTFSGNLTGTGGLVINATGTQTLSGSNSYTGSTTVSKGKLKAGNSNAFSASSATTVEGGAILDLGDDGRYQTINNLRVKYWATEVNFGTLKTQTLSNEGKISLKGLEQSRGSITNSGDISLGTGGLKAEQVTNSGFLTVDGPAEVESLVNSANATFVNLKVDQTSSDHSIKTSQPRH